MTTSPRSRHPTEGGCRSNVRSFVRFFAASGYGVFVVVNKSFADRTWPGESPIGKRLRVPDDDWRTVVGVVGDTRHFSLNEPQLLQAYIPHAQRPQIFTSVVVRARGNPDNLVKPVQQPIWRVDRDQPVWRFRSMQRDLDAVVTSSKTTMWLIGLFALVALVVAAVGVYGVLSYTMAQRTQEVGIRMALGAQKSHVLRLVLRQGMTLTVIGVIVGLAAAFGSPHADTFDFAAPGEVYEAKVFSHGLHYAPPGGRRLLSSTPPLPCVPLSPPPEPTSIISTGSRNLECPPSIISSKTASKPVFDFFQQVLHQIWNCMS